MFNQRPDKEASKHRMSKPNQSERAAKYRIVQGDSEQTRIAVKRFVDENQDEECRKMPGLDLGCPLMIHEPSQPFSSTKQEKRAKTIVESRPPSPSDYLLFDQIDSESPLGLSPYKRQPKRDRFVCHENIDESCFNEFSSTAGAFFLNLHVAEMQDVLTFGDAAGSITRVTKPVIPQRAD